MQTSLSITAPPSERQHLDEACMRQALQLAERGRYGVHPNPMVGAVIIDKAGKLVGQGFHQKSGEVHAEVMALQQAGEQARDGTIYVTLEPCNHQGKTGPCTEAIIAAGLARVVVGTQDPNPQVAGSGLQRLQQAGIHVEGFVLEEACQTINQAFNYHIVSQAPYVTLKLAMTADGQMATRQGHSQWITNKAARQWVHQLRAEQGGILTTAQTVVADDCQLTVREGLIRPERMPRCIVIDRKATLAPSRYKLFNTQDAPTTWVIPSSHLEKPNVQAWGNQSDSDTTVLGLSARTLSDPVALMQRLYQEGLAQLLVECGPTYAKVLLEAGVVNRLVLIMGPALLMDSDGLRFKGALPEAINQGIQLNSGTIKQLGDNWVLDSPLKVKA